MDGEGGIKYGFGSSSNIKFFGEACMVVNEWLFIHPLKIGHVMLLEVVVGCGIAPRYADLDLEKGVVWEIGVLAPELLYCGV